VSKNDKNTKYINFGGIPDCSLKVADMKLYKPFELTSAHRNNGKTCQISPQARENPLVHSAVNNKDLLQEQSKEVVISKGESMWKKINRRPVKSPLRKKPLKK
jgi:hypothetical protein